MMVIEEIDDANVVATKKEESNCVEMNAEDSEDYRFECLYCDFKTSHQRRWTTHVNYLHWLPEITTDPDEEGKNANFEKTEAADTDTHWADIKVEESEETEDATNQSDLKSHIDNHVFLNHCAPGGIKWFYCDKCVFKAKTGTYLNQHLKYIHSDFTEWHYCKKCTMKTKSKYYLKQHMFNKHFFFNNTETPWFKCDLCPFQHHVKSNLHTHVAKTHGLTKCGTDFYITKGEKSEEVDYEEKCCVKVGIKQKIEKLTCGFCYYVAATKEKILKHISVHHNLVKVVKNAEV